MNAAVSIVDTFSRNTTDSWGSTDTGQPWLNETSAADVNGTYGTIAVTSGTTYRTHYIDLDNAGYGKQSASSSLAMVRWSSSTTGADTDFGLALNITATNTFYFCSIHDSIDLLELGVYINGSRWQLNQTGISVTKDTDYWIRYEVNTSGCRVKVWKVGTAEPGWQLTSGLWSGSNPPGKGHAGTYHRGTTTTYTVQFSSFYYYTGSDTEPGLPQSDTFERTVSNGFGVNATGTVWQGNVAYDPDFYVRTGRGFVTDPGDGFGQVTIAETAPTYGLFGPRRTTDAEVYTEFSINSSVGNTFFYVGLRGRLNPTDGSGAPTGYGVYIPTGATTLGIRKCTNGTWSANLATSAAFTALAANTKYSVRFQVTGGSPTTTVRARIWVTGSAEPGTWNVTYADNSPIGASGSSWFELSQSVTTSRNLSIYRWDYQLPTATVTNTQTTTVSLTSSSITDTTLNLRANFSGDTTGMNNTISVRYRPSGTANWSTENISVGTRQSTYWPFTITGLVSGAAYIVEVTYADADGVAGTNPITNTFTTTQLRMTPGVAYISAITATTVSFVVPYSGDSNNNSTAKLNWRVSSANTYPLIDPFNTAINIDLENHTPEVGLAWVKRGTPTFRINNARAFVDFSAAQEGYYTNNVNISETTFQYDATFRFDHERVSLGLITHFNTATLYHYKWYYNAAATRWEISRTDGSGTAVIATSSEYVLDDEALYTVSLTVNPDYKALNVNGVEIIRTTDTTLASGGVGLWGASTRILSGSPYESGSFGNIRVTTRAGSGAWSTDIGLGANRANKTFGSTFGGFPNDSVIEFKITYADADGLNGTNAIQYVSGMTTGQAVSLASMTFTPQYTTAVAFVNYSYDSNSDSTLSLQYRSTMETMWTTLPANTINVNRGAKQFSAVIPGLRPGMSYVVLATISDPNGVIEGGNAVLSGQFSTLTTSTLDASATKQFLWKVYDRNDDYVGTWHDAGVPDFSWNLDSGLGDCTIELNRPFASLNDTTPTVDTMYRVDVVASAPQSTGLTPNLLNDTDFHGGMWIIGANGAAQFTSGPDGGRALRLLSSASAVETVSENIFVTPNTPVVGEVIAQAKGGSLKIQFRAYDSLENVIETSNTFGMTVGVNWQRLRVDYLPPRNTAYVRMVIVNDGEGVMYAAYPFVSQREMLVYRGFVQSYEAKIDDIGERLDVELYSQSTVLSDDVVEWLQFVSPQPAEDATDGKPNRGEADPSDMLKALVDLARQQNPRLPLYYTDTSIKQTGVITDYTFEEMTFQEAFEAVISLAPLDWHFTIAPDGLVSFFAPKHVTTHRLRLGVEVSEYTKAPNIKDIRNYIIVYGTQEEGKEIKYIEFDQESVDTYGRRVEIYNESGIESERAAEIWAQGKLAELTQPTLAMEATIPDTNSIQFSPNQTLRGYAIERFKPGDLVVVTDPVALPEDTLWDQFRWDVDSWDSNPVVREVTEVAVPIKTIEYDGDSCVIELAERPPSVSKEHARLWRYIQKQERKARLGIK